MLHEHDVDGGQEAGPLLVEQEEDEDIEAASHHPTPDCTTHSGERPIEYIINTWKLSQTIPELN